MSFCLGIDIGGTAIKHGVVGPDGTVSESGSTSTPREGRAAILDSLAQLARGYRDRYALQAVGVGTAGVVNYLTGTVLEHSPNLPGWGGTPVAAALGELIGLPVTVDNDANCMAVAEMQVGAGRHCKSLLFLTLGTGIGSAVVVDGQLWRGANGMGGEFGHATVVHDGRPCACGQRGHLEAYASATALVKRALELAREGIPSGLPQSVRAASALGSHDIFAAAKAGDAAAIQAVAETTAFLASGIASAVNLLDPELVVIGGGMAAAGPEFLTAVERESRARVHADLAPHLKVVPAELGNQAGLIGAALLAWQAARKQA